MPAEPTAAPRRRPGRPRIVKTPVFPSGDEITQTLADYRTAKETLDLANEAFEEIRDRLIATLAAAGLELEVQQLRFGT